MQQHPIPQNVTTYQFRIVGDMTLKQFVELASGVVIAVILYNIGLPAIVKWPFMTIFAATGAAFAFLPLQGRPLDIWVKNFLKSVYMPTIFLWQKEEKLPSFFSYKPQTKKESVRKTITPEERAQYSQYMQSLPQKKKLTAFDQQEGQFLNNINKYLQTATGINPLSVLPNASSQTENNIPSIRVRQLQPINSLQKTNTSKQPKTTTQQSASQTSFVPKKAPVVKMAESFQAPLEIGTPYMQKKPSPVPTKTAITAPPKKRHRRKKEIKIVLPPPPEFPNILCGIVLNNEGKVLPNAIIEIRDKSGMPVRASKTNKVSQFSLATPLQNGTYEIEVEHPDFSFDIIKLNASGSIIPPITIKAKHKKVQKA